MAKRLSEASMDSSKISREKHRTVTRVLSRRRIEEKENKTRKVAKGKRTNP